MDTRVIFDQPRGGAENMALDEASLETLAQSAGTRNGPAASKADHTQDRAAILRFYRWQPATLSLGYFQRFADREQHAASRDCLCVRRASGGGAILHDRELTYSFTIRAEDFIRSKLQQHLYRTFHKTLIATLAQWGIAAETCAPQPSRQPPAQPFLCFQRREAGDVLLKGFKIVGSAQRRRQGAILQHGSILLQRSHHAPELPGIKELSGVSLDAKELASAWLERLVQQLQLNVDPGAWPADISQRSQQVMQTRYVATAWTRRR